MECLLILFRLGGQTSLEHSRFNQGMECLWKEFSRVKFSNLSNSLLFDFLFEVAGTSGDELLSLFPFLDLQLGLSLFL